jgi:hypothetical protein
MLVRQELGIELHAKRESEAKADIFRDLKLEKSMHPRQAADRRSMGMKRG